MTITSLAAAAPDGFLFIEESDTLRVVYPETVHGMPKETQAIRAAAARVGFFATCWERADHYREWLAKSAA